MRRLVRTFTVLAVLIAAGVAAAPLLGQEPRERPRLYLDCGPCERDYTRTEITFVDFVLDRAVADIHLLVTTQTTGSGGREYTLHFIGLGPHEGQADTLVFASSPDDTDDVVRRGLTRTIKLGLAPFVAGYPVARSLDLTVAAGAAPAAAATTPADDPWNFWVFRVGLNGNFDGEAQRSGQNFGLDISANRVTEDWKLQFEVGASYSEGRFEVDSTTEIRTINRNTGVSLLAVKSMGDHFSAGLEAAATSSTFGNQSLVFRAAPAIEYNFFRYAESTRRQLTALYSAGANYYDYREVTVYDEVEETRPQHSLRLGYTARQPWGSVSLSVRGSQFLHDTQKYRLVFSGSGSVRVFRGLEVSFFGSYSEIHDQLSLPAGDATPEEIFLRLRQLATDYSYYSYISIGYRFGSIFSNVVNPRFRATDF